MTRSRSGVRAKPIKTAIANSSAIAFWLEFLRVRTVEHPHPSAATRR